MGLAYVAPIGAQNLFMIQTAMGNDRKRAFLTALILFLLRCAAGHRLLLRGGRADDPLSPAAEADPLRRQPDPALDGPAAAALQGPDRRGAGAPAGALEQGHPDGLCGDLVQSSGPHRRHADAGRSAGLSAGGAGAPVRHGDGFRLLPLVLRHDGAALLLSGEDQRDRPALDQPRLRLRPDVLWSFVQLLRG